MREKEYICCSLKCVKLLYRHIKMRTQVEVQIQILVNEKTLLKTEVLIQLLHSSRSNEVQTLKCTQSIKVKLSLHFCVTLTEP